MMRKHGLALLLFLFVIISYNSFAQNAISSLSIDQINYTAPYNVQNADHFYFHYTTDSTPPNKFLYLNIVRTRPLVQQVDWVADNLPVPPIPVGTFTYQGKLEKIAQGQDIDTLQLAYFVTDTVWNEPPVNSINPGDFQRMQVGEATYHVPPGISNDSLPSIDSLANQPSSWSLGDTIVSSDSLYRGCDIPNIDLDDSEHGYDPNTGYAGDENACGPAATANSMQWLENEGQLNDAPGQSLREKLEDLSELMGRDQANERISVEDFIQGKMQYIDKHKLDLYVKYQSNGKKPPKDTIHCEDCQNRHHKAGIQKENGNAKISYEWVKKQMKEGEDVEIIFENHVATLSGMGKTKSGRKFIIIKHDTKQNDSSGTKQEVYWGGKQDWPYGHVTHVVAESPRNLQYSINSSSYNEDFEGETSTFGIYTNDSICSWERGVPKGSVIANADSDSMAWVTNLSGPYNPNDTCYLTSIPMDLSVYGSQKLQLSFSHIYELDSTNDYHWVAYSDDNGDSWQKLGTNAHSDLPSQNWYDVADQAWHGQNSTWHTASHGLPIASMANIDSVRFRFAFVSGASVENEGVGIDNVRIEQFTGTARDEEEDKRITAYYHKGTIHINFQKDLTKTAQIELMDVNGRKVMEQQQVNTSGHQAIDVPASVSNGYYLLRITTPEQVETEKLIVR